MLAYSGGTCVSEVDKTITLLATPELSFPAISSVCIDGGTVQLGASELSGISGTGVYTGTGVSNSGLFNPSVAGLGTFTIDYIFTATDACADTVSQTIMVLAAPSVASEGNVIALQGGSVQLEVKAEGDSLSYQWSPTTGLSSATVADPFASPSADITYTLTVTNNLGCSASAQVSVSVLQSPVIPNTFTPNGDGINDTWDIKYLDSYPDCTVQIFSRWGERVFSSIGYPTPWDGNYNGKSAPSGVYYYVIDPKHGRNPLAGWVTIIR
jgi:gliding motility-associated-like protein